VFYSYYPGWKACEQDQAQGKSGNSGSAGNRRGDHPEDAVQTSLCKEPAYTTMFAEDAAAFEKARTRRQATAARTTSPTEGGQPDVPFFPGRFRRSGNPLPLRREPSLKDTV
jgi:hypothetical protein